MASPSRIALPTLAVLLTLVAVGCGGGSSPAPTAPPAPPTDVVAANQPWSLRAVTSDSLTSYFRTALANAPTGVFPPGASGGGVLTAAADFSGTTLQEAGVDEGDWVKSDGVHVFSLDDPTPDSMRRSVLRRQKLADGQPLAAAGSLALPFSDDTAGSALYLDDARSQLVALGGRSFGEIYGMWFAPVRWGGQATEAVLVDAPATGALHVARKFRFDAALVGSRRVDGTLYLVLRSYPVLPGATTPPSAQVLQALTPQQVLPTVSVDGGSPQALVRSEDCLLQQDNAYGSGDIVTLVAIDLAGASHAIAARCFIGGTEAFYLSPRNLYLATTRVPYATGGAMPVYAQQSTTDIHKFALDGLSITYRGSGNVPGHLGFDMARKSFRMGEAGDTLGVVTQLQSSFGGITGGPVPLAAQQPAQESPGRLSMLREGSGQLLTIGSLPNAQRPGPIGQPGELLYATRFLGDRAYVVTYRLTDPLYVIDLANPADPKVAGELHVEGYSDYLFPLDGRLLLGVGKDAIVTTDSSGDGRFAWYQGVKVSLIDVSDPAHPVEAARTVIGHRGTDATVLHDHHGIALLSRPDGTVRVSLPVSLNDTSPTYPTGAPNDYWSFTRTELARFEVNLAARTLVARPSLAGSSTYRDISADRSLLWHDQVFWYRGGDWQSAGW